jgi:hypothetical protein
VSVRTRSALVSKLLRNALRTVARNAGSAPASSASAADTQCHEQLCDRNTAFKGPSLANPMECVDDFSASCRR